MKKYLKLQHNAWINTITILSDCFQGKENKNQLANTRGTEKILSFETKKIASTKNAAMVQSIDALTMIKYCKD